LNKPDVDYIEGLSPAVSIDQRGVSHNPRSTVGTVTEVYDYLRLLFARVGQPHCPICGKEVHQQSAQEIVDAVVDLPEESRILVLAPMISSRKGTHQNVFDELRRSGFVRARVDGEIRSLDEEIELDRYKNHNIDAVVDRLVIPEEEEKDEAFFTRVTDSVETALRWGEGMMLIANLSPLQISPSPNISPAPIMAPPSPRSSHAHSPSTHLTAPAQNARGSAARSRSILIAYCPTARFRSSRVLLWR
jgi:excinuclease ABC subunit A